MRKLLILLVCVVSGGLLAGCGSSDADPNYTTEIKKTEADLAREKEVMGGQQAPGAITPGQPVGTMKKPGQK